LLAGLRDADPATTDGSARYLLDANDHLGRALRARGRRWLRRWTPADGLVDPDDLAREALAGHQLGARPFSPTALQHFAACPYRFFLQAVMRLQPREEPVAIEVLDPLTRGALFHEVQFAVLSELRAAELLPVRAANLDAARSTRWPRAGPGSSGRRSTGCGGTASTASAPTCASGCGARRMRTTAVSRGASSSPS